MMDLLDPILTCTSPVIVPEMTIILAVVSSFLALFATAVNLASVETVVTVPPFPPVVPPLVDAYPVVAISVIVALFTIRARSTTSFSVGVGAAATN